MNSPAPTAAYLELAQALRRRTVLIADREYYARDPAGHLRELQTVSEQIAQHGATLPTPMDPRLAHYLQRCSYEKALQWIESTAMPE